MVATADFFLLAEGVEVVDDDDEEEGVEDEVEGVDDDDGAAESVLGVDFEVTEADTFFTAVFFVGACFPVEVEGFDCEEALLLLGFGSVVFFPLEALDLVARVVEDFEAAVSSGGASS